MALFNGSYCSARDPPSGWSVPDKVYLGHRQLRTYQQMPDAEVSVERVVGGTAVRPQRELVTSGKRMSYVI